MTTDDREWRFDTEEVGPDADERPARRPIEPESIDPEHALFVVVGVVGTVLLIAAAAI